MQPMIYDRRDTVTVVNISQKLKKYDLILYKMDDGKIFLHRIVKVYRDGTFECRGDNNWHSEDKIRREQIIGIVKEFNRNGKSIFVDKSIIYYIYTRTWFIFHHFKKYYKYVKKIQKQIRNYIYNDKVEIVTGDGVSVEILFRQARKADSNSIQKLCAELIEYESKQFNIDVVNKYWYLGEKGKKYFETYIDKHFLFIALCDKKIIGYALGNISNNEYNNYAVGYLKNIFVDSKFRGIGIGKCLIGHFKEYCKNNNCHNISVTFIEKNFDAEKFYKSQGFNEQTKTYICNFEN